MPNAVEPPSESPTRLEAAYALLAELRRAWRPLAGGTDLMVQITGEIGEPPERVLDIWALDELRGIAVEADALVIGALTTYTSCAARRSSPSSCPRSRRRRRPSERRRSRTAARSAGTSSTPRPPATRCPCCWRWGPRSSSAPRPASERSPADEFWTGVSGDGARPDELVVRIRIPLAADRTVRFRKIGTRRAQAISKVVMALAWRATATTPLDRRAARPRLGGRDDDPRARRRGRARGRRARHGDRRCGADRPRRPSSSRSTTFARPPTTGGPWRAGCCIG